jgi:hypothetical protein
VERGERGEGDEREEREERGKQGFRKRARQEFFFYNPPQDKRDSRSHRGSFIGGTTHHTFRRSI